MKRSVLWTVVLLTILAFTLAGAEKRPEPLPYAVPSVVAAVS